MADTGGRRTGGALNDESIDAALEREIEQALHVDPSPEFLARVRARVAAAPARLAWNLGWPLGAAAAVLVASAALTAAFLTLSTDAGMPEASQTTSAPPGETSLGSGVTMPDPRPQPVVAAVTAAGPPPGDRRGPPARPAAVARDRVADRVARRTIDLPDVIVSEDEVRAFQALVEMSRTPQPEMAPMVGARDVAGILEPAAIVIPPIEIEPIQLMAIREGDGE